MAFQLWATTREDARRGVGEDAYLAGSDDGALRAAISSVIVDYRAGVPRWAPRGHFAEVAGGVEVVQPWAYAWRLQDTLRQRGVGGCTVSVHRQDPGVELTLTCTHRASVIAYTSDPCDLWTLGILELAEAVAKRHREQPDSPRVEARVQDWPGELLGLDGEPV